MKFIKIRDVHAPTRATEEAAGIDFYVPEYSEQFLEDLRAKNPDMSIVRIDSGQIVITVEPHSTVMIPSGIKACIEPGTALIAANKSGIASKKHLVFMAQVVDSDYSGEIGLSLCNVGSSSVTVQSGDKIIQFIHSPVLLDSVEETSIEDFTAFHAETKRGENGFGSGVQG